MSCKLSPEVVVQIFSVYKRIASDQLLTRCARRQTQNANESLHSVVWKYCPKEVFVSKGKLEFAVLKAVMEFNMGCRTTLELLHKVRGDDFTTSAAFISERRDTRRCNQSSKRKKEGHKQIRKTKKIKKIIEEDRRKKSEGLTYSPGAF